MNECARRVGTRPRAADPEPEKVLLPLDVGECPLDTLAFVRRLASQRRVTIVLLHVIKLNILAPENRVYLELEQEARAYLQRIADRYLPASCSTIIRVRYGPVTKEILAEARDQGAELIVLRPPKPGFWSRVAAHLQSLAYASPKRVATGIRRGTGKLVAASAR